MFPSFAVGSPRLPIRLVRHLLVAAALRADLWARPSGRLEAEALAFQVEALAREAEELRGLIHVAVGERHRVMNHRALEMLLRGAERLIEPDQEFRGQELPVDGGN